MTFRSCSIYRLLTLILLVSTSGQVLAQEAAAPQNSPAAAGGATAAAVAGGSSDFDKLFGQWKQTLTQLEEIRLKFRGELSDANKADLKKQFLAKVEEGNQLVPKLVAAAEKKYQTAPATDTDLDTFLVGVAGDYASSDQFSDAFRIGKMLIDGGTKNKDLPLITGASAIAMQEFDLADKYLAQARDEGAFGAPPKDRESPKARVMQLAMGYMSNSAKVRDNWIKEQEIRKAEAQADDLPRVKLQTNAGDVVVELYENEAPEAVANFISLVEKGFYDGLIFHRVLPNFMAQGGCPQGSGTGGPGYSIPCECHQDNYRRHFSGTLSMAHAGRDTGGSQFFLTFVPTTMLDGRHTAFGRVIEGMEVLPKIKRIDPQRPRPGVEPTKIEKATVLRKRDHAYEPKKLPGK